MVVYEDSLTSSGVPRNGVIYILNKENQIIKTIKCWWHSSGRRIYEYEYDTLNNIIRSIQFYQNGDIAYDRRYKYVNNQIVKMIATGSSGIITETIEVEYDHQGNMLKIVKTNILGTTIIEKGYEYDKKGNWIKCTRNYNGEPQTVTVREIEYY